MTLAPPIWTRRSRNHKGPGIGPVRVDGGGVTATLLGAFFGFALAVLARPALAAAVGDVVRFAAGFFFAATVLFAAGFPFAVATCSSPPFVKPYVMD
jgi:hypothetical protein